MTLPHVPSTVLDITDPSVRADTLSIPILIQQLTELFAKVMREAETLVQVSYSPAKSLMKQEARCCSRASFILIRSSESFA